MLGMGLGMLLAHITRGHALSVWASFLSLTVFHMYGKCSFIVQCSKHKQLLNLPLLLICLTSSSPEIITDLLMNNLV